MARRGLDEYARKRHFDKTPEPPPSPASSAAAPAAGDAGARKFVVQRHRARRLHYDFRLEIDGVLVSWAVPRGPTLDPDARRLAVHVEDHPLDYADFEGVIPAGEYGGGDVIVWDQGTWAPSGTDDPRRAVEAGELHADLNGEKLRGRFVLVRTSGTRRAGGRRPGADEWLLLHKRDEAAEKGWDAEDHPRSVVSGRTNDEVAADPESRQWHSNRGSSGSGSNGAGGDRDPVAVAARVAMAVDPDRPELEALDRLPAQGGWWRYDGVRLRLTNLDKVLFPPAAGSRRRRSLTKRDLIRWYADVAPVLVPYLADRAVNLHRYPDGVEAKGFWHKAVPSHAPEWITRWPNPDADPGETSCYLVPDRPATVAWLANFGAVELHPWTSPTAAPDRPSYALIDIDPGADTTWEETLTLARLYRTALEHLHVTGYPKVTGRRGVQIWIPVSGGPTFDDTRAWVETLSRTVGRVMPELVSWRWGVAERGGLARLDYTQNAVNKTLVAPYSVRAAPGAPVSMPIRWAELDDPDLRPDGWTITNGLARLAEVGDLFAGVLSAGQALPALGGG